MQTKKEQIIIDCIFNQDSLLKCRDGKTPLYRYYEFKLPKCDFTFTLVEENSKTKYPYEVRNENGGYYCLSLSNAALYLTRKYFDPKTQKVCLHLVHLPVKTELVHWHSKDLTPEDFMAL